MKKEHIYIIIFLLVAVVLTMVLVNLVNKEPSTNSKEPTYIIKEKPVDTQVDDIRDWECDWCKG